MALMVFAIWKLVFWMCVFFSEAFTEMPESGAALMGVFAVFTRCILRISLKALASVGKYTAPVTYIQSLATVNQSASSLSGDDHGETESHGDMS